METRQGRVLIGRLEKDTDLYEGLMAVCRKENVRLGFLAVVGAVSKVKLGYYNQNSHKYIESVNLNERLEITSCLGDISLKESEVFVHAHITLANDTGQVIGGHLLPGTVVFSTEYFIQELSGPSLERKFDEPTGLFLWNHS